MPNINDNEAHEDEYVKRVRRRGSRVKPRPNRDMNSAETCGAQVGASRAPAWLRLLALTALLSSGVGAAQGNLEAFLATLESYPSLQAARTSLALAEARLRAAYDPFSLQLNSAFDPQPAEDDPTFTAGAGAVFRPFLYGERADLVRQSELALAQAQLDYDETLANLEVEALEAAWSLQLAEESVQLAREGVTVAERALASAQARLERGVANPPEVRDAELGLAQAENLRADAQDALTLAAQRLETFVGEVQLSVLPEYPVPEADVPLTVQRARFEIALEQIDVGTAQRSLLPVVQASYNVGLDARNALSASISSDTLAPRVGYSYTSNGADTGFRLEVSYNIELSDFETVDIASGEVSRAEAALQNAAQRAQLERSGLDNALASAQRNLDLAQRTFENAQQTLGETQSREELGLSLPLETQQAAVAVTQAGQDFQAARLAVQAARFDLYEFYALPPSSVTGASATESQP